MPVPVFYTTRALAEKLEVPYQVVREWAFEGQIPCIRVGRRYLFKLDEVMDALCVKGSSEPKRKQKSGPTTVEVGAALSR
jgi:excisionase family DNA binding protein